jgi:hypothetical protein
MIPLPVARPSGFVGIPNWSENALQRPTERVMQTSMKSAWFTNGRFVHHLIPVMLKIRRRR